MEYQSFLESKAHTHNTYGFDITYAPKEIKDFQKYLLAWAVKSGRSAVFADCGLGKTLIELAWAENLARHTGKNVLILAPLAVSYQFISEGEKFGIDVNRSIDGTPFRITVTNYERLNAFKPSDFVGCVLDESSILKNFNGARKAEITNFMRKMPYRLLATATAAPNDFTELGTSSEALGCLGYMDMLNKFFKNDLNNSANGRMRGEVIKWRLKGHAEKPFWRWVCSWAKSVRKPSDIGFSDSEFVLPPIHTFEHTIKASQLAEGYLFELPSVGLQEQREEMRRTLKDRCNYAADIANESSEQYIVWCNLNDEGNRLESSIRDSIQVSGSDYDDEKEAKLLDFAKGDARVLVIKPKIGAFGLNFQNCRNIIYFPTHSYEQYYQSIRRCWRFGQKRDVRLNVIRTDGQQLIMDNLKTKMEKADQMFHNLVAEMNNAMKVDNSTSFKTKEELPQWLATTK